MTETLLEHNRAKSSLMGLDELDHFTTQKEFTRCGLCENNCALTVTIFNDGSKFVTGNRCELKKSLKSNLTAAIKKKTSLIINIKNSLSSKHLLNEMLYTALSVFLVCLTCMKITHFGTLF